MLRASASRSSGSLFRKAQTASLMLRAGDVRTGGGAYAEKERAQENFAVSQKDAELLQKLRETLKLQEGENIPTSVVETLKEKREDRKEALQKKWRVPKEETLV